METKNFSFELSPELIAAYPPKERGQSRLMHLDCQENEVSHHNFNHLVDLLPSNSLLVFNDTRVRKARLKATRETGGEVEVLLLQNLGDDRWLVLLSKAKKQKIGTKLIFSGGLTASVVEKQDDTQRILQFDGPLTEDYLEKEGKIPLPPYMNREAELADSERYQTIYSQLTGSAAAPTAGLHFTDDMFERLKAKGIECLFITLHVGVGTFLPIRSDNLDDHKMHSEEFLIEPKQAELIQKAKQGARPVFAVGTTVIRALESASNGKKNGINTGWQSTNLFIQPGYQFKIVDGIFTNFHTPESSLMVLIASFAGLPFLKKAYQEAIDNKYRFFSYGDCMLLYPPVKI